MSSISFNSKSTKWNQLSNFYGGVEFMYQQGALNGAEALFAKFQTCNSEEFIHYIKLLQPGKKWTSLKEKYWFNKTEPIRGILAKLTAGARTNPKRMRAIRELAPDFSCRPLRTIDKKKDTMLRALRVKFSKPKYANILLSTGTRTLHEKPMRGNGAKSLWTYKVDKAGNEHGQDFLGQLLMIVREELVEQQQKTKRNKKRKMERESEGCTQHKNTRTS